TCPTNTVSNGCCYDALVYDSTEPSYSFGGPWQAGQLCPLACYDLPHGLQIVNSSASPCGCGSAVQSGDRYQIAGIPAIGPLVFTARLHVVGRLAAYQSATAVLQETGGNRAQAGFGSASPPDRYVTLTLSHAVGETFELFTNLSLDNLVPYAT